jgi:hypothetical protein
MEITIEDIKIRIQDIFPGEDNSEVIRYLVLKAAFVIDAVNTVQSVPEAQVLKNRASLSEALVPFYHKGMDVKIIKAILALSREHRKYVQSRKSNDRRKQSKPKLQAKGKRVKALDGKWYPVTEKQLEILQALFAASGEYIQGKHLPGQRPDKAIKRMEEPVKSLIESNPQNGYRIPSL